METENTANCLECGKLFECETDIQLCEDCQNKFNLDELYIDNKNGGSYKKVLNGVTYNYDKSLPIDWWDDLKPMLSSQHKDYTGYATQKPKALIERIIKASSNECDLVADFYAGSFTTAEVCKDLNRNFIGCDINPRAVEIGKKRCV